MKIKSVSQLSDDERKSLKVDSHVYLHQEDEIFLDPTVRVDWNVRINGGRGCHIGRKVHIATGCVINAGNGYVEIGDHSGCSNNVVIAAGQPDLSYEFVSAAEENYAQFPIRKKTIIGRYTVIFANATICPGVTIGDYCIIAAGAVVIRDVPDYTIVGGVPAKKIGYRRYVQKIEPLNSKNNVMTTFFIPRLENVYED